MSIDKYDHHNIFTHIFYINLDRRPDRNTNVQGIMEKYNLKAIRISAIDGNELDLDKLTNDLVTKQGITDAKDKMQRVYIPLTKGAIGCALSHREVWRTIINNDIQNALVLEDDIIFDKKFHQKLEKLKNKWPRGYDIIYLGYHQATNRYIMDNITHGVTPNKYFTSSRKVFGTFGYIVSNEGARKLLGIFPITYQFDGEILNREHNIKAYLVRPDRKIIFSEPSEAATIFGTDIQKR
jgi:GR25 family glycosyltransferase involved in LPS biosynthesis